MRLLTFTSLLVLTSAHPARYSKWRPSCSEIETPSPSDETSITPDPPEPSTTTPVITHIFSYISTSSAEPTGSWIPPEEAESTASESTSSPAESEISTQSDATSVSTVSTEISTTTEEPPTTTFTDPETSTLSEKPSTSEEPVTTTSVSEEPTTTPVSEEPTTTPVSEEPTTTPVYEEPTTVPTSEEPTTAVSTSEEPTAVPTSEEPTTEPTSAPTASPTCPEPGTGPRRFKGSVSDVANIGFATLNGGTTGGAGGKVVVVSTLSEFSSAVSEKNTAPVIVVVNGTITGNTKIKVGSNKTIIGLPGSGFVGIGLTFKNQRNLILRNIVSSFVEAANGDGLTIDASTNVWVDHCEFFSTLAVDKDKHDGLVDASHGADFITISHTYFHDHWKGSLAGHNDNNHAEDVGKLHITYANNYWYNVNSRGPLFRYGTGHVYNSYYTGMASAINSRMGAKMLVQNTVFRNVNVPVTSRDSSELGYATVLDSDLGGRYNDAPEAAMGVCEIGYPYTLIPTEKVAEVVQKTAGAVLGLVEFEEEEGECLVSEEEVEEVAGARRVCGEEEESDGEEGEEGGEEGDGEGGENGEGGEEEGDGENGEEGGEEDGEDGDK